MGVGTYEYDADQIAIDLGGIKIDSGYADGSFVKIEKDAKWFEYVVGTDGSVTRSKTKNKVAKITIYLMQSSYLNDQLSALLITDFSAANGAGIVPFMLKDQNGTTLAAGAHAWIEAPPDQEYDRGAKSREWPIICSDLNIFVGSNPKL
jgi:hypothetical protein